MNSKTLLVTSDITSTNKMQYLTIIDLERMKAEVLPPAPLPICSRYLEQIQCPICLLFREKAMVVHEGCMHLMCAFCVLASIEATGAAINTKCGFCRSLIFTLDRKLLFMKPLPNDNWMIDNLEYRCEKCNAEMKYKLALTHCNICDKRPVFQPPTKIHKWDRVDLTLRRCVSNPMIHGPLSRSKDRLVVFNYNGNQLASKFVSNNWEVWRMKQQIARMADIDQNELRLFVFRHEELDNSTMVRDISPFTGVLHVTAVAPNDMKELTERFAIISLHDQGPPPAVS